VLRNVATNIPERFVPAQDSTDPKDIIPGILQTLTSRDSLGQIILTHNLYPGERQRMPAEEVISQMRADLRVALERAHFWCRSRTPIPRWPRR